MQQKINLYKLLPKKTGFVFNKKSFFIYGILVVFLFIFYLHAISQRKEILVQHTVLNKEVAALQTQLNDLSRQFPAGNSTDLQKGMKALQQELENKNNALLLLIPYATFAGYLVGLSDAATQGVWYTEIIFSRKNASINLKGYALKPILLTELLTNLVKQPVFKNVNFDLNQLQEEKTPVDFLIISRRVYQV